MIFLRRPVTRTQRRGTEPARSDSFSYNGRNELTGAALGAAPYGYSYDNIGNRKTAQEPAQELAYAANELNQYTRIEENAEAPFAPQYDASGNQTLIRTSTGIWTVAYNAVNRATSFTSRDGATVVECGYDYQGRRFMKKVTVTAQSPAMNAICTRLFADRPPWTAGHRTNRINKGEPSICFLCLS